MNETRVIEINNCDECKFGIPGDTNFCGKEKRYITREDCPLLTKSQYVQRVIREALGDE